MSTASGVIFRDMEMAGRLMNRQGGRPTRRNVGLVSEYGIHMDFRRALGLAAISLWILEFQPWRGVVLDAWLVRRLEPRDGQLVFGSWMGGLDTGGHSWSWGPRALHSGSSRLPDNDVPNGAGQSRTNPARESAFAALASIDGVTAITRPAVVSSPMTRTHVPFRSWKSLRRSGRATGKWQPSADQWAAVGIWI